MHCSSGGGWISYGKLYSVTSYGYSQEIDRLYATYPEWQDDAFVRDNLARWRA